MIPELLRHKVEKKFGAKIKYGKDCKNLSSAIEKDLANHTQGNKVSHITLKRAFDIICHNGKHSEYTLDILSRYVGWGSWNEAITKTRGLLSSNLHNIDVIISANLDKGQIVKLVYYPERKLKLFYEGENLYKVLEVSAGKLREGDLLTILRIELNLEFVCEKVVRNEKDFGEYISNTKGSGVVLLEIEP